MMSESIDETLDKDEAEEETEDLTNQVCIMHLRFQFVACLDKLPNIFGPLVGAWRDWCWHCFTGWFFNDFLYYS